MGHGYFRGGRTRDNRNNNQANSKKIEELMPWFSVFDLSVVKLDDELPTKGYHRTSHHHLHDNMRYSVKKP